MTDIAAGEGNLNQELDESGADDFSRLAKGFNRFVAKIKRVVDLVIESSSALAQEAGQMSTLSQQAQSNAGSQTQQINDIADAINEMTDCIEHISSSAAAAANTAQDATSKHQQRPGRCGQHYCIHH